MKLSEVQEGQKFSIIGYPGIWKRTTSTQILTRVNPEPWQVDQWVVDDKDWDSMEVVQQEQSVDPDTYGAATGR